MSRLKLKNCTPHVIRLKDPSTGLMDHLEPCGLVPRLQVKQVDESKKAGFPLFRTVVGDVEGLPDPEDGVMFITSTMVAQAAKRPDIVAPDTGPTAIREDGQVVAVTRFQIF